MIGAERRKMPMRFCQRANAHEVGRNRRAEHAGRNQEQANR